MRRVLLLTTSITVLAALCLGAAEEKTAIKTGAPATAKAAPKTVEKPVASPSETVGTKSGSKPADKEPTPASPISDKRSPDGEALRLTVESFTKAYDAGDAKAIAAHFTLDAEYIDEQGNVYEGRAAIEAAMTACFAEHPGCQIEFDIETIRFISPGVAVEDGTTTITHTHSGDMEPVSSLYTAVHVKTDGKWLVASMRDHVPKERRQHRSQLEQLGWLKGEWVDEGDDSVVMFSCECIDNDNFLLRKFTIQIDGQEAMSGTQRIGWDPLAGKLRTWIFDSEGGYSDGFWFRDEDRWLLKATGVTADGQTASGTSIYTVIDENTMTWQLVDYEVAGVQHDDSDVVTIVRRAPSPGTADETPLTKSN